MALSSINLVSVPVTDQDRAKESPRRRWPRTG
jgi:hypothetical protein